MDDPQCTSPTTLNLLGVPEISVQSQSVLLAADTSLWLLTLLGSTAQPLPRGEILALLYPEAEEGVARNRLRQALHRLRSRPWGTEVVATPGELHWRGHCDVRTFRDACAAGRWVEALAAYRGPLLGHLQPTAAPAFETWLDVERDDLQQLWIEAALSHAEALEVGGQPGAAQPWLAQVMSLSPFHEEAVQISLRCAALMGDIHGATQVYERFRTLLRRELGVVPAETTTALYGAVRAGPPQVVEPPRPGAARTPLIGRQTELEELHTRLDDPACRLLSLTGPGGAGKTRLALELLRRSAPRPAGTHLVPLETATSVPTVVSAIMSALNLTVDRSLAPESQLTAALQSGRMLLALDNLEHLLTGDTRRDLLALLTRLLAAAPEVQLITTSRIRLGLQDEWVMPVGGLDLPIAPTIDGAAQSGAVRLFLERARRVQPDVSLTPHTLDSLLTVVEQTGGMPLALELTAGWLGTLTLTDVAGELRRGLNDVSSSAPDRPARHRSLQTAFDQSWALLPQDARVMLARLSVCRGGFDLEAARAVGDAGLQTLLVLGDHSLLTRDLGGRYTLHAVIREFASARLRGLPLEEAAARAAHAAHYTGFAGRAAPHLRGPDQQHWLTRLDAEHDNMRTALAHFVDAGDAAGALTLAADLHWFWYVRGHHHEGHGHLITALALPGGPDQRRCPALCAAGSLARDLGHYAATRVHLEEALALSRVLRRPMLEAQAHHGLALLDRELGALQDAQNHLRIAETLQRAVPDDWGLATTLNDLGIALALQGNAAQARILFQDSLTLKERIGDRQGVAYALANLGNVTDALDDFQRLTEQSLEIKRGLGDRQGTANSLFNLADLHINAGRLSVARAQLTEALQLYVQIGRQRGTAATLLGFAKLSAAEGDPRRCMILAGAADALLAATGVPMQGVDIGDVLSEARLACGTAGDDLYLWGRLLSLSGAIEQATATPHAPAPAPSVT